MSYETLLVVEVHKHSAENMLTLTTFFQKNPALKQQKSVFYLFGISMAILEALICHTKVRHFANIVFVKENVSSRQVTMDNLSENKEPEYKS